VHGDGRAWDSLVDRYQRLVYAVPLRLGLGPDDAADITQEAFAALLRSLPAISTPSSLGSWLMTVARRLSWHCITGIAPTVGLTEETQIADDPNDELVLAVWLYEAIESLGEPCASVIRSLFFEPAEPTYSEIARRLGCSIGTVGPLRARCLDRLRQLLTEEDGAAS
jgi:RNA polymerase sigma factor (sigma-70 family)